MTAVNSKNLVSIVIPIYKVIPTASEIQSLRQCLKVLDQYEIIFVAPFSLNVDFYNEFSISTATQFKFERFPDFYFENISGYNRLMLSVNFYQRFIHCKYILIYQLDAFIFTDKLSEWCMKGYDYIAAPWMDEEFVKRYWRANSRIGQVLYQLKIRPNQVGNGGFSLRKVRKFIFLLKIFRNKAKNWYINSNEDFFWSLYIPYYYPLFKIPQKKAALSFAFETQPEKCYEQNNARLPMGCHAWEKHNPPFWLPFIQKYSD